MNKKITIDFSIRTVFTVVFAIVLFWLLYALRDILVLFFVAFVLSTALEPAVDALEKRRIPRFLNIIFLYLLIVLGLYMLIRLIIPPIADEVGHLVANRSQIIETINNAINRAPESVKGAINEYSASLPEKVSSYSVSAEAVNSVLGIFSSVLGFITIFVVSFYLLLEKNTMENFIFEYWPGKYRKKQAVGIFKDMVKKVSLWVRGQLVLSGSVGFVTYIGLTLLGIPYAITLSLIAAVTEVFPVIGPFIGALPAVIVAYSISPISALWVGLFYLAVQQLENHILVPQVMKRAVGLSPVAVIFSILVGGKLLGVLGIIIAVPVASALSVLIQSLRKKEK